MSDAYLRGVVLTVEWDPAAERIAIHAADEGLKQLVARLSGLIGTNGNDHVHMMTSEWGGSQFSSEKQNPNAPFGRTLTESATAVRSEGLRKVRIETNTTGGGDRARRIHARSARSTGAR